MRDYYHALYALFGTRVRLLSFAWMDVSWACPHLWSPWWAVLGMPPWATRSWASINVSSSIFQPTSTESVLFYFIFKVVIFDVNLDQLGRKGWISSHSWKKKKKTEREKVGFHLAYLRPGLYAVGLGILDSMKLVPFKNLYLGPTIAHIQTWVLGGYMIGSEKRFELMDYVVNLLIIGSNKFFFFC